jgi:hypothetical protein
MNPAAAPHSFPEMPPAERWSWKRTGFIIVFALAAQLAFIFLLGTKKTVAPLAVTNVPVFRLADNSSALVRLTDPTLFALPHVEDFVPAAWSQPPTNAAPVFSWVALEPARYLALAPASLGAAFNVFMQTNHFSPLVLGFKPDAQLAMPQAAVESLLPQNSTWRLAGDLAGRRVLNTNTFAVPPINVNDVIAPSRVQLLVDKDGNIASAVLLESSAYAPADQEALALAQRLQFARSDKLMFGEIIFNWHTVPLATTNAP